MVLTRIALYEDHPNLRRTLSHLIRMTKGFELVGEWEDCLNVVENQRLFPADVVLMDIGLPGIDGIEGTRRLKAAYPDLSILILTVFDEEEKVFEAIRAGATGYLLKKAPPARITEAIREIQDGGAPMNAQIARMMIEAFANRQQTADKYDITERENQVLRQLVAGKSYKAIGAALHISPTTVRFHLSNIYKKLHVQTMSEAVAKAIRERIV